MLPSRLFCLKVCDDELAIYLYNWFRLTSGLGARLYCSTSAYVLRAIWKAEQALSLICLCQCRC
jgi:hypothetical protein